MRLIERRRTRAAVAIAFVGTVATLAATPTFSQTAASYPSKPIRLVAPFPAGGVLDLFARITAQKMSERMGRQVIVDNRAGASGIIGFEYVARSAPDGYTLVVGSAGTIGINPSLYAKLPFDVNRDFVGVALIGTGPVLVAVHPTVPAKSIRELIALAKARPGEMNYGSAGNGTTAHLSTELFALLAGVKLTHVPYKGSGPAAAGFVGGEVGLYIENIPVFIPYLENGRVRALGVSGEKRFPSLPQIPTVVEGGLKGYNAAGWWGVFAPTGTPKEIIARLHSEIAAIVAASDVRERMLAQGALPSGIGDEKLAAFVRDEQAKWARAVKESGARVE
ncbi:MAG TPA: tripartite tricarboxylate transporter substrate binding protein [Burkholderiales bacterium]|nr:tripartite tricarboxylate transporter substrate binding protein [Burkholderiales bacterium]